MALTDTWAPKTDDHAKGIYSTADTQPEVGDVIIGMPGVNILQDMGGWVVTRVDANNGVKILDAAREEKYEDHSTYVTAALNVEFTDHPYQSSPLLFEKSEKRIQEEIQEE